MLAFRLFVDEDTMGALNPYSKAADAFDDESREIGAVFAAHAAWPWPALAGRSSWRPHSGSRDVIEQAKGLLMAPRDDITSEEAFAVLRKASQRLNVELRDIAGGVVTGNA